MQLFLMTYTHAGFQQSVSYLFLAGVRFFEQQSSYAVTKR